MSKARTAILTLRRVYDTDKGDIDELTLQIRINQLAEVGDDERVYTITDETDIQKKKTRTFIDRDKKTSAIKILIKCLQTLEGSIK